MKTASTYMQGALCAASIAALGLTGCSDSDAQPPADLTVGDELPQVQQRFYRCQHSHHRKATGSGLGLAIVSEVTELHGGQLEIKSAVGVGTRVKLTLPVYAALSGTAAR